MSLSCDPSSHRTPDSHRSSEQPVPRWLLMMVTWFGSGLSPKAPGTMGSLAALPFAAVIAWCSGPVWASAALCLGAAIVFVMGWWSADRYVRLTGTQDPGLIVIDEVAAMWLTLAVAPLAPWAYGVGFVYFRIFDILKPWPVCVADRSLHGGFGIMADDILAAIYAALCLWLTGFALSL